MPPNFILLMDKPINTKLKYLFIDTYKVALSHTGLQSTAISITSLYYFSVYFNHGLKFKQRTQRNWNLGPPHLKAVMLVIKLHSINRVGGVSLLLISLKTKDC